MYKFIIVISFIISQVIGIQDSQLLKDPIEIKINGTKAKMLDIEIEKIYIIKIEKENYLYKFTSDINNIFYIKKENEEYELKSNSSFFENGDTIYINPFLDISENTIIKIYPFPIYNQLNSFQTIKENQNFFIKSELESIAYFGSFDKNSKTYICELSDNLLNDNNITRINDRFNLIEANKIYYIQNEIYDISVFNKYFYPLIYPKEISIIDDNINFLYLLKSNDSYTLDFTENKLKKIIKLSTKTFTSKISIFKNDEDKEVEINCTSPYYILDEPFNGKLTLKVEEDDAFLEFISSEGDPEILAEPTKNHITNNNLIIIEIPITQKSISIEFNSNKNFQYSLSLGLSNKRNYYYSSSSNLKINSEQNREEINYLALFKNIDLLENEFVSFAISFEKEENQNINISYSQFSGIDELLDEKIPEDICKNITKNLQDAMDFYIYSDIAQNPPQFKEFPNYHHRKINLKGELGQISPKGRKFYEFYQEVKKILTTPKDLHFHISAIKTNNGIKFNQYYAVLPFDFILKEYGEKNETRLFIKIKEKYLKEYDKKVQNFINDHLEIPIKRINDIDPFDYIQNWSPFHSCKNQHSQFTYIINKITGFYLYYFPLNYSNISINDYEFEDNTILRIPYLILKPKLNEQNKEFDDYFLKTLKKSKYLAVLPPLEEIKEEFLIYKGLKRKLKKEIKDQLDWNVTLEYYKDYFKCREDNINKVNVMVQNSFYIPPEIAIGKIFECENYSILIIIHSLLSKHLIREDILLYLCI